MADEPQTPDADEELLLTEEAQPSPDDEGAEEEEVPTFGDTDDEVRDTDNATMRHMRERLKEANKRISELERTAPAFQPIEVGPEPSLWDDDIEGDEDKLKEAIRQHDRKAAEAEKQKATTAATGEEQRKQLETRLAKLPEQKAALGKADADDALDTVRAAIGEAKFAGIVGLLDDTTDPAKFFYALAQNPQHLESVASQQDGIRLLKDITRLEGQLKMVKRRKPIDPDTPERGSAKISTTTGDKKLEQLRKEAKKSGGDYSKVAAYKAELKAAAKQR